MSRNSGSPSIYSLEPCIGASARLVPLWLRTFWYLMLISVQSDHRRCIVYPWCNPCCVFDGHPNLALRNSTITIWNPTLGKPMASIAGTLGLGTGLRWLAFRSFKGRDECRSDDPQRCERLPSRVPVLTPLPTFSRFDSATNSSSKRSSLSTSLNSPPSTDSCRTPSLRHPSDG
ncbi:hypothetical protein FA13DRAFT_543233 [Coprinellus micaceus]|uniref:Uncharacterized protein n=1 Tax=Coprinellus micaceus TaxID=71717 RepID=A0A4Y7T8N7_COPMI|nr:hypothetical protein FA13DRAFT_543233 [Coprinellus micaceus]